MKYRAQDPAGDYQFGRSNIFLVDSPAAVAQAIKTKLLLATGEWFLDSDEGTPYSTQVLGYGTQDTRDLAIRDRILSVPGVTEIVSYTSSVSADRRFTVAAVVSTKYGTSSVSLEL